MATRHKGTKDEARALDAYVKLVRAAESVSARLKGWLERHDLTESQFGTLEALHHLGPLHQCELGAKLLRSSGNVTFVVDHLEGRGLVRRERGKEDRRFISVHLTPAGERLIATVFPTHAANVHNALAALTGPQQEELARLCRTLGKSLNPNAAAAL